VPSAGEAFYPGPRPYREDESTLFFGRAYATEDVVDLWYAHRLLLLYGRAGVGKTSLLLGGVIPTLRARSLGHVLPLGRISVLPRRSLAGTADNPYVSSLLTSWLPDATRNHATLTEALVEALSAVAPEQDQPVLAAIDQFEEFFGLGPRLRGHREAFVDALADALVEIPRLRLLLCVQKEFLAEALGVEPFLGVEPQSRYRLLPLEPEEAEKAISGPWADASPALDEQIVRETVQHLQIASAVVLAGETENITEDPVDPLILQLACRALWPDRVIAEPALPSPRLAALGNGIALVVDFCAQAVAAASTRRGIEQDAIWEWLARTFVTEIGTRRTVSAAELRSGDEDLSELAETLVEEQLLGATDCDGLRCYELLHDRLIEPVRFGGRHGVSGPTRSPDALLIKAIEALEDGDLALAEKRAVETMTLNPDDVILRAECELLLGRAAARRDHGDVAEALLRSAASLFASVNDQRSAGRAQARLGRILMERGQVEAAMAEFYSAAVKATGDQELAVYLARALRQSGDARAGAAILSRIPSDGRIAVEAYVERAQIYFVLGELRAANADLRSAIELDPTVVARTEVEEVRARIDDQLRLSAGERPFRQ
jgi:Flp pilus assembly protein TadD